jgi:uncharacterized membrane protein
LGEAYYAQQRQGGSAEAVAAALTALDQHVAAQAEKEAGVSPPGTVDVDAGAGTSGPVVTSAADVPPSGVA